MAQQYTPALPPHDTGDHRAMARWASEEMQRLASFVVGLEAPEQLGIATSIATPPAYLGQLAVAGGRAYIGKGTSTTADWLEMLTYLNGVLQGDLRAPNRTTIPDVPASGAFVAPLRGQLFVRPPANHRYKGYDVLGNSKALLMRHKMELVIPTLTWDEDNDVWLNIENGSYTSSFVVDTSMSIGDIIHVMQNTDGQIAFAAGTYDFANSTVSIKNRSVTFTTVSYEAEKARPQKVTTFDVIFERIYITIESSYVGLYGIDIYAHQLYYLLEAAASEVVITDCRLDGTMRTGGNIENLVGTAHSGLSLVADSRDIVVVPGPKIRDTVFDIDMGSAMKCYGEWPRLAPLANPHSGRYVYIQHRDGDPICTSIVLDTSIGMFGYLKIEGGITSGAKAHSGFDVRRKSEMVFQGGAMLWNLKFGIQARNGTVKCDPWTYVRGCDVAFRSDDDGQIYGPPISFITTAAGSPIAGEPANGVDISWDPDAGSDYPSRAEGAVLPYTDSPIYGWSYKFPLVKTISAQPPDPSPPGFPNTVVRDTQLIRTDGRCIRWTATLTIDNNLRLPATAGNDDFFLVTRTGGGAFNLNVTTSGGTLIKAMAVDTSATFHYDEAAGVWYVVQSGGV